MGPELQYTSEKPADPLTLWVYTGADAAFELYEDDGVTYGYEKGVFSTISLHWDEKAGILTLGQRQGEYPGMPRAREVRVVFVTKDTPIGHTPEPPAARVVRYEGDAVVVTR